MHIALLAAGSSNALAALTATCVVFGTALVAAWLMRLLRAPTILGLLLAGIVIGPSGLDAIAEDKVVFFAELALAFLLFAVGLELSPQPLLRLGTRLLLIAGLQMGLTAAVTVAFLVPLGLLPLGPAILVGLAVSLSSTAIVLRHLSERGETDTPSGTLIVGILLLQDVVVILVLLLLPLFVATGEKTALQTVIDVALALGGLVIITVLARLALPYVVRWVFRFGGAELMTLFALVMACTGAWLAGLAHWSWALGSFIAGLLLAQTDLRHQLHAEITPLLGALSTLFFISIGMLVDLELVAQYPLSLAAAVLATLVAKIILTALSIRLGKLPTRLAVTAGFGLCTISEFGYVLVKEASVGSLAIVPAEFKGPFVAWSVGTMLIGAALLPLGTPLALRLIARGRDGVDGMQDEDDTAQRGPESHVIIVGYGLNGRNLARVLQATRVACNVVEMNRTGVNAARAADLPVLLGDAARASILREAGIMQARALVVAISDTHATRRIVAQARTLRPDLYILARTRQVAELEPLRRAGANEVIPEEFETSIELFVHLLREFAIPDNIIRQQVQLIRAGHYGMLRSPSGDRGLRPEWLAVLEAAVTQTHLITSESTAAGRTLRALDLRARTGVTVVAITRRGTPTTNPPADYELAAGDVLVLVGTHHQLDEARTVLDEPRADEADATADFQSST